MSFRLTIFVTIVFFYKFHLEVQSLCDEGWYQYKEEKCFKLIGDLTNWNTSWDYGNKICVSNYQGQLASIHSEEENNFIFNLLFKNHSISSNVWLGGKRFSGDVFNWTDATLFNYSSWGKQYLQPSGDGDCVEIWSPIFSADRGCPADAGKWNDHYCNVGRQAALCQRVIMKDDEDCNELEEENRRLADEVKSLENKLKILRTCASTILSILNITVYEDEISANFPN